MQFNSAPEYLVKSNSVLIVGVDSEIGSELYKYLQNKNVNVSGTTRKLQNVKDNIFYMNLENPNFDKINDQFDTVVICASITNIKYCESNIHDSEMVNFVNTIKIIDYFSKRGIFILYLSSSSVFSGRIPFERYNSPTSPTNNYGKLKVKVENYLLEKVGINSAILRLTKVISKNSPIIKLWERDAIEKKEIIAYSNKNISPIQIDIVLDTIYLLISQKSYGIYQLGGGVEFSYTDFAKSLYEGSGVTIISEEMEIDENEPYYNSLETYIPTKEFQYTDLIKNRRITMGLMSGHAYMGDAKRLAFTLSRYKFVSKMFSGFEKVLEVGCADAFGTPIVANEVKELVASDFDLMFINDARKNHPYNERISFIFHDMVSGPVNNSFEGIFSLDVLEHIDKSDENRFMTNICKSLDQKGACIIGMPSIESQIYASEISKMGHVNCKSGQELKDFCENYFQRVFIFSMNDEVVHTGFQPMSQYLLALCCFPLEH